MKKKIIEFFYPNLTFFRSLWRSLRPSWCFLRVYYWLKYYYGSFSQSSSDAKHVRIGLKNKKKFCWKKKIFIEISDSNLTFPTESIWEKFTACQLWVSKKIFWDLNSKIPLPQFCRAWSGAQIKYPQHGHISWIEGYKNSKVKKIKISYLSALLK